jgi:hypothetical protein
MISMADQAEAKTGVYIGRDFVEGRFQGVQGLCFREGEGEKPAPFGHAMEMIFHKGKVSARINPKRFK